MAANPMLFKALLQFFDGLLHQLLVNLAGENGEEWYEQLGKFLRKEITWEGGLHEANAFAVVEGLEVPATKEPQPLCKNRVFNRVCEFIKGDEDLLNRSAEASPAVKVLIGLTTQVSTNSQIFSKQLSVIGGLEKLRLRQSQISAFCSVYREKLTFSKQRCCNMTVFLCTVDDKPVRSDFSNLRFIEVSFWEDRKANVDHRFVYIRNFYRGKSKDDMERTDGLHVVFPIQS